jgi:hypothetical protein
VGIAIEESAWRAMPLHRRHGGEMIMGHMLKYHVLIPIGLFLALLVVGVPVGTAFVVGMMTGCMAMVFMMAGHGTGRADEARDAEHRASGHR